MSQLIQFEVATGDLPQRLDRLLANQAPELSRTWVRRMIEEGQVPLISVEGKAYDCGAEYGRIVADKYPGYRRYLDAAWAWKSQSIATRRLSLTPSPQPQHHTNSTCPAGQRRLRRRFHPLRSARWLRRGPLQLATFPLVTKANDVRDPLSSLRYVVYTVV